MQDGRIIVMDFLALLESQKKWQLNSHDHTIACLAVGGKDWSSKAVMQKFSWLIMFEFSDHLM